MIAENSRTILTALSHPCGLAVKRFVVVEPWTLLGRSRAFRWLAGHRTYTPLPLSLHAHVYMCGNLGKGTRTRTELNMTSGSSANQARRLVDALESIDARSLYASNMIISKLARFPRCHPVPLTSCPMTSSCGIPQHLCATGQDRTLGDIPEFLRLRKRDAMQLIEWFATTRITTFSPQVPTWHT